MPLLDHFRPPTGNTLPPAALHSVWATEITRRLNSQWLREPFRALPQISSGTELEIDIAAQEHRESSESTGGVATLTAVYAPPAAQVVGEAVFPDVVEVRVFEGPTSWYLVGAVEIVSRSNKKSPTDRDAFLGKVASYLRSGVSVVLIDIVTDRLARMHDQLLDLIAIPGGRLPPESHLAASAYRPVKRDGRDEIDVWFAPCRVGEVLPTMPLRLAGDTFVPIEFELTYTESLRAMRPGEAE
jgi:hypothetical protein